MENVFQKMKLSNHFAMLKIAIQSVVEPKQQKFLVIALIMICVTLILLMQRQVIQVSIVSNLNNPTSIYTEGEENLG